MAADQKSRETGNRSPERLRAWRPAFFPNPWGGALFVSTSHVEIALGVRDSLFDCAAVDARMVLAERAFRNALAIERKRTERSGEPFLLMVVEDAAAECRSTRLLERVSSVLLQASRGTDFVGWYKDRSSVGTLFTALAAGDREFIRTTILRRLSPLLENELSVDEFNRIRISFHFFPDTWHGDHPGGSSDRKLYPDLMNPSSRKQSHLAVKRAIDVVGSVLILLICFPLFLAIALAIKLTSKGPVFFRQGRVGQYGREFVLFKFRTMQANNDPSAHREYVTKLIANQAERNSGENAGAGVYKLTNDPRITRVGKFLRRSSLDELPQILNVLKGDMSLVGPRPPIPYELMVYETWHRRRLLEAKPGVTGLWQVTGRSQVRFDEMVRLDLRYATSWSLWLDVKILLRTPLAVLRSAGAY
jgi:lipopolysaccharide/colanic/teichoic acid biosynthesis glycosyltransferase